MTERFYAVSHDAVVAGGLGSESMSRPPILRPPRRPASQLSAGHAAASAQPGGDARGVGNLGRDRRRRGPRSVTTAPTPTMSGPSEWPRPRPGEGCPSKRRAPADLVRRLGGPFSWRRRRSHCHAARGRSHRQGSASRSAPSPAESGPAGARRALTPCEWPVGAVFGWRRLGRLTSPWPSPDAMRRAMCAGLSASNVRTGARAGTPSRCPTPWSTPLTRLPLRRAGSWNSRRRTADIEWQRHRATRVPSSDARCRTGTTTLHSRSAPPPTDDSSPSTARIAPSTRCGSAPSPCPTVEATAWAHHHRPGSLGRTGSADNTLLTRRARVRTASASTTLPGRGRSRRIGEVPLPVISFSVSRDMKRAVVATREYRGDIWMSRVVRR